jgi:hypothetical protein
MASADACRVAAVAGTQFMPGRLPGVVAGASVLPSGREVSHVRAANTAAWHTREAGQEGTCSQAAIRPALRTSSWTCL